MCLIQLAVQLRTDPFSTPAKNLLQFIGTAVSALVAFFGLIINYLNVSRAYAKLAGQVEEAARLTWQIDAFKKTLAVITIGGIACAAIIQVYKLGRKRRKIGKKVASMKNKVVKGVRKFRQRISSASAAPEVELPDMASTSSHVPQQSASVAPSSDGESKSFMENPLNDVYGRTLSADAKPGLVITAAAGHPQSAERGSRESGGASTTITSARRHDSEGV